MTLTPFIQGVKANVLFFDNKEVSKDAWIKDVWFYDYLTNVRHIPQKHPMSQEHLSEFIDLYQSENRNIRSETWSEKNEEGRWRRYSYNEITTRDKKSLDIFWIKENSLTDSDNLPVLDVLANEIFENIESGLDSFKSIMETINKT